jgi:hypothetical protein
MAERGEMPKELIIVQDGDNLVSEKFSITWGPVATTWLQIDSWDIESRQYHCQYLFEIDRDEINKLIKILRKARDQAYGKDE